MLSEPWLADRATIDAWLPVIERMLKGEDVHATRKPDEKAPVCYNPTDGAAYFFLKEAPQGSVAVHVVAGLISKYDTYFTDGTETLMRRLAVADKLDNICGHLLEIDSGGGQGTNIETVARFIRGQVQKPVVAWFNGTAASAAYWIAAAADEVYASQVTDQVGSIGAYASFLDFRKMLADRGIVLHEVYAEQSDLKNVDLRQARDGDYELLREQMVNPLAACFISHVKELRPGLTEETAYRGAIFTATKAKEIGMIDGLLTFEQALQRINTLAQERASLNISQQQPLQMKKIEAVLGSLEKQNGGVFLNEEQIAQLEAALLTDEDVPVNAEQLTGIEAQLKTIAASQATVAKALTALQAEQKTQAATLATQAEELKRLGDAPGAGPTKVATKEDPANANDDKYDALEALNALAKTADRITIE